jgi:hypothetical protein
VIGVGVFRDVEILLHLAARVREKGPVRADASAELVCFEQIVGRDGDQAAVADLHLAMQLQQPFVLPPVFRAETATCQHQHQRIPSLQLGQRAVRAAVVGELVVGKHRAGNDIGSHDTPCASVSMLALGTVVHQTLLSVAIDTFV